MKFALKGFFSILLLIAATGWTAQSYANGTCAGNNSCASSCGCTDLCQNDCNNSPLCSSGNIFGKTFYAARSQGDNSARKQMYTDSLIHRFGSESFYGVGFLAVEYQQNFRNKNGLAQWFSSNNSNSMDYGPIMSSDDNGNYDLNSLQFGVTATGAIAFCPKTQDMILDFNLYFGLDELFCGLWARLDVPVAWSKRSLNLADVAQDGADLDFPLDLYGAGAVESPFATLKSPMAQSLRGLESFGDGVGEVPALLFGKICGHQDTWNAAGLRFDVGYDWFRRDYWHFASSFQFVVPVGSTPSAEWVFDAMVGDSKRAQVGGTINFFYELWNNCDATSNIGFYLDGTFNTLLKKRVQRLIGLNPSGSSVEEAVWSQYLVLKEFNNSGDLVGLERAANILATDLRVGAGFIGDISMLLQWNCKCYFAGLGYEFWVRTAERASQSCLVIPANTFAIKGVQDAVDASSDLVDPYATINSVSENGVAFGDSANYALPSDVTSSVYDYNRALHPQAYSNKVFAYAGYNWNDCDWQPFVLVGGEVEFGHQNKAISQWGVLGKGGLNF